MAGKAGTVNIVFLGDATQLDDTLLHVSAAADVSSAAVSDAFSKSGAGMSAFNDATSKAGNALTDLGKKGQAAGIPMSGAFVKLGNSLDQATSKTAKLSAMMAELGKVALVGGIAAFAVAAVEGVKGAADLQQQMEKLHTQAGATQSQVATLTASILKMASSVGTSPQTLADGMYHVVSSLNATIPAAQRVSTEMSVLKVSAEGAKVGNANLTDVTNALDAAVVSGIKGVQNYQQAMGALNATVGAGDMTMQDLADALGTGLLAPAKTFGLSIKDIGSALAVFGDNNIRGADAATKLRQAIVTMGAPSAAASAALASIGLQQTQLADDMRSPSGLVGALSDLKSHLDASGADASQQALILSRAFGGGRTATAVMLLLDQLDRLKAKEGAVGAGATGFAAAWAATTKNISFEWSQLTAGLASFTDKLGGVLIPKLQDLGHFLADNKTEIEDLAKAVTGVLAVAVGAFVGAKVAAFVNGINNMRNALAAWYVQNQAANAGMLASDGTTILSFSTESEAYQAATASIMEGATQQEAAFAALAAGARSSAEAVAMAEEAMVATTDSAAAGIDGALMSTGIGAALVALGVAADVLLSHWQTIWPEMQDAVVTATNGMRHALNGVIDVINVLAGTKIPTFGTQSTGGGTASLSSQAKGQEGTNAYSGDVFGKKGYFSSGGQYTPWSKAPEDMASLKKLWETTANPSAAAIKKAEGLSAGASGIGTGNSSNLTANQVATQVMQYLSSQGFNQTAIAGILGNAQQESSMNPNTPGGGLFQQISNFGQGTGGSLQNQLQTMLPQIEGLKTALNTAQTPAAAADIFEKGFERAGIPDNANRESYATSEYTAMTGKTPPSGGGTSGSGSGSGGYTSPALTGSLATYLTSQSGQTALQKADLTLASLSQRASQIAAWGPQQVGAKEVGALTRAGTGPTGIYGQAGTIKQIEAATTPAAEAQAAGLAGALNAANNPTLTKMAQSIETSWAALTTKLATIVSSDTTAANSELQTLQSAQNSTSIATLKNTLDSTAQTGFNQLVTDLSAIHTTAMNSLVTSLKANWAATLANLQSMQGALGTETWANILGNSAAVTGIKTTAAQTQNQAATQISGLQSTQAADQLNAAATAINDAAKVQTDQAQEQTTAITDAMNISNSAATAQVTSIKDAATLLTDAATIMVNSINAQTTSMQDTSNAQVSAIQNQTQIQVDTLGERGLYGLALVAQEAKVALDQQVAIDDANIAAAQAHVDQVTAATNQAVAIAQQTSDTDAANNAARIAQAQMSQLTAQQANDASVANAQMAADSAQANADATIAQAQAANDTVQITSAIADATAQQAATAAALQAQALTAQASQLQSASQFVTGSQVTSDQAQASLLQESAANANSNAASIVQSIQSQTAIANQTAANALQQAQAAATNQEAQAAAALAQAQGAASTSNAQQQATLAAIQNAVNIQAAQDAAALSAAQSAAQISQAQAAQQLASIQTNAAVTEAKLTSIYNVDQELAQVQYAGSGVNVYVTGIPMDNAAAIAAATSYAIRYNVA